MPIANSKLVFVIKAVSPWVFNKNSAATIWWYFLHTLLNVGKYASLYSPRNQCDINHSIPRLFILHTCLSWNFMVKIARKKEFNNKLVISNGGKEEIPFKICRDTVDHFWPWYFREGRNLNNLHIKCICYCNFLYLRVNL